jgi:hypothetical protein
MAKEVAYLAEELVRALEEFGRTQAERIVQAKPQAPSAADMPLVAFERTFFHDAAHERVMSATKVALDREDHPFLRAVVDANHGEPSRMYSGSNGGYFNCGIGGVLLDLVRPYVMWNLFHLRGDGHARDPADHCELPLHDSDEHLALLRERLRPLLVPRRGVPDYADGESVRTCSKALFRAMYMSVAFLMSGTPDDWSLCREHLVRDVRRAIDGITLPSVSASLYTKDEGLADLPYV